MVLINQRNKLINDLQSTCKFTLKSVPKPTSSIEPSTFTTTSATTQSTGGNITEDHMQSQLIARNNEIEESLAAINAKVKNGQENIKYQLEKVLETIKKLKDKELSKELEPSIKRSIAEANTLASNIQKNLSELSVKNEEINSLQKLEQVKEEKNRAIHSLGGMVDELHNRTEELAKETQELIDQDSEISAVDSKIQKHIQEIQTILEEDYSFPDSLPEVLMKECIQANESISASLRLLKQQRESVNTPFFTDDPKQILQYRKDALSTLTSCLSTIEEIRKNALQTSQELFKKVQATLQKELLDLGHIFLNTRSEEVKQSVRMAQDLGRELLKYYGTKKEYFQKYDTFKHAYQEAIVQHTQVTESYKKAQDEALQSIDKLKKVLQDKTSKVEQAQVRAIGDTKALELLRSLGEEIKKLEGEILEHKVLNLGETVAACEKRVKSNIAKIENIRGNLNTLFAQSEELRKDFNLVITGLSSSQDIAGENHFEQAAGPWINRLKTSQQQAYIGENDFRDLTDSTAIEGVIALKKKALEEVEKSFNNDRIVLDTLIAHKDLANTCLTLHLIFYKDTMNMNLPEAIRAIIQAGDKAVLEILNNLNQGKAPVHNKESVLSGLYENFKNEIEKIAQGRSALSDLAVLNDCGSIQSCGLQPLIQKFSFNIQSKNNFYTNTLKPEIERVNSLSQKFESIKHAQELLRVSFTDDVSQIEAWFSNIPGQFTKLTLLDPSSPNFEENLREAEANFVSLKETISQVEMYINGLEVVINEYAKKQKQSLETRFKVSHDAVALMEFRDLKIQNAIPSQDKILTTFPQSFIGKEDAWVKAFASTEANIREIEQNIYIEAKNHWENLLQQRDTLERSLQENGVSGLRIQEMLSKVRKYQHLPISQNQESAFSFEDLKKLKTELNEFKLALDQDVRPQIDRFLGGGVCAKQLEESLSLALTSSSIDFSSPLPQALYVLLMNYQRLLNRLATFRGERVTTPIEDISWEKGSTNDSKIQMVVDEIRKVPISAEFFNESLQAEQRRQNTPADRGNFPIDDETFSILQKYFLTNAEHLFDQKLENRTEFMNDPVYWNKAKNMITETLRNRDSIAQRLMAMRQDPEYMKNNQKKFIRLCVALFWYDKAIACFVNPYRDVKGADFVKTVGVGQEMIKNADSLQKFKKLLASHIFTTAFMLHYHYNAI